tara:strand:+ start:4144 stop:4356 length:213 start_codon:yes stop_codon:yes gene_type:complete
MESKVKYLKDHPIALVVSVFIAGLIVMTVGVPKYREYQIQKQNEAFFDLKSSHQRSSSNAHPTDLDFING